MQRFFRRWHRQYRKLFNEQWTLLRLSRLEGTADQVHELRVTVRRLRLMLRVAGPLLKKVDTTQYESWSRKILDGTSTLRDYDATIEWLQTQPDTAQVLQTVNRDRSRLWRQAKAKVIRVRPQIHSRLARFELNHRGKVRLEKRFHDHVKRLEDAVTSAAQDLPSFGPEERHVVRRKLRRLKYLKEIGLPKRKQRADRILKWLIRLQNAMGDHQNLVNAGQIFSRILRREIPEALDELISQEKSRLVHAIDRCAHALGRCRTGMIRPGDKPRLRKLQ